MVLQAQHWNALLKAKDPVRVIYWRCADHGSDEEEELELHVDGEGMHVMENIYTCKEDGARGRLIARCVLGDECDSLEDQGRQPAK